MLAIPAIDIRDGACVQLVGGSFDDERLRIADPVGVLCRWVQSGFRRVHVVDLDAALGTGVNRGRIDALLASGLAMLQIGGGVRSADVADELIAAGADRVVVGTRALEEPEWLKALAARHPNRIIAAVDVRDTAVVTPAGSADWRSRSATCSTASAAFR